jgi:hypothetical protein
MKTFVQYCAPALGAVMTSLILFIAAPASAFHPLITDDTGTQGKGNTELEFAYRYEEDRYRWFDRSPGRVIDGTWGSVYTKDSTNTGSFTASYGIIDPLDIIIGVPYCHTRSREGRIIYNPPFFPAGAQGFYYKSTSSDSGIGDPTVEVKWQFFSKNGLSLAIKPGATLPLGNEDEGFGSGRFRPYLYFILSYETDYFNLHFNTGYIRNENNQHERQDIWHGSIAFEVVLVKDYFKFIANTGLERNPDMHSRLQDVFVLGGFVVSPTDICDLDVGFKYSIDTNGSESPGADYTVLAGVTVRFEGPKTKEEEKK